LPQTFFDHPAVRAAPPGELVHPFVLYMDGVPFSRSGDNILGLFCYFLLSHQRHLVFTIRNYEMCGCGCRGLCSLIPVFHALAWDFQAMLGGVHPAKRHNGEEFRDCEGSLATNAGRPLGLKAVCLFIKADWAEWVHTMGFPNWQSDLAPCPLCFATAESMYQVRGFSPLGMPHEPKSILHYNAACNACEVVVVLSPADIRRVRPRLSYEKRKGFSRGRVLQEDLPDLGLVAGDRLCPTMSHPDIAELDPEAGPRETVWWRASNDTIA
jgi:hypothetical protein